MTTRGFQEQDASAWDHFVTAHPQSSLFHLTAWKRTIEESFGYQPRYLLAMEDGRIRGVLPLFLVKNPVIGQVLVSSPFAVYGGILADCDQARQMLYDAVRHLGAQLGVDHIELRNAYRDQCVGEPNIDRYVTFTQELSSSGDLLESLPKKTRNLVRKALKTPFEMRYNVRDPRVMDEVHSRNMRRLGTPNFPVRYFKRLLANFGDMADIREVWHDNTVMAVSLNLYYRGQMHTYHAAADQRFNALSPNMFMYYDHLRWASENGFPIFDFGRSKKDTGPYTFKTHWKTTMRELPYEIILVRRKTLPNFSPANPKFALPIKIWKCLPLPVTRMVSRVVFPLFP
jgi:FemAB-related protein (PEP-CTERM system-associated)